MNLTFRNGQRMDCLGVHGSSVTYQGVTRDCLTFLFPAETELAALLELFTPENCAAVTLEDGGSAAVHEHYTIRTSAGTGFRDAAIGSGIRDGAQACWVSMAQSTMAERMLLSQQEAIDCLLTASLEGGEAHV